MGWRAPMAERVTRIDFSVLGPLEVREDGRPLPLGGRKQRALLALLVLNANRVVPKERMIDELWGEAPPESAVATVHVYISRLRKLLGEDVLVSRAPGYVLLLAAGALDLEHFDSLRASGRTEEALGSGAAPRWPI